MKRPELLDADGILWRKSSYSGSNGSCVETASGDGVILVRDTTGRDRAIVTVSAAAWEQFTAAIRQAA